MHGLGFKVEGLGLELRSCFKGFVVSRRSLDLDDDDDGDDDDDAWILQAAPVGPMYAHTRVNRFFS